MSDGQGPALKPVMTVTEMDGRVEELERQRNEALTRCAKLAGTNALMLKTLGEARAEIERLNALIPMAAPLADNAVQPDESSVPTLN